MARYRAGLATRERILEATRAILGSEGFENTTLKAICDSAGIQAGSFYNLFPSKDEAVLTVVREAITAVDPHPDGEGTDRLAELVDAYTGFIAESPLAAVYLQLAVTVGLSDEHLKGRMLRHHRYRIRRFADAIRRDHPDLGEAEARVQAEIVIAGLNGLAYQWVLDPSFDLARYADGLVARMNGRRPETAP
ncbi:MAG: TetR/AcrR family transcriptional regulator [Acidimicrobiia bacterium]|nr:TetR/AcrR family transcriptional regulator [Acidimicrobiia bacterium]